MNECETHDSLNSAQTINAIASSLSGLGDDGDKTEEEEVKVGKRLKSCTATQETEQIHIPVINDVSVCPKVHDLPLRPPPAIETNYVQYYVLDFQKPGHDQYIYRHANGLCVIGLASTHVALGNNNGEEKVKAVDFNVGKSSRSDIKVTGKRKKNAHFLEINSALCKVIANDTFYIIRCCVKGSLLEVNERLIKEPDLLNRSASSEGYVAIMMPRPEDWLKSKSSLLSPEEYKMRRGLC